MADVSIMLLFILVQTLIRVQTDLKAHVNFTKIKASIQFIASEISKTSIGRISYVDEIHELTFLNYFSLVFLWCESEE